MERPKRRRQKVNYNENQNKFYDENSDQDDFELSKKTPTRTARGIRVKGKRSTILKAEEIGHDRNKFQNKSFEHIGCPNLSESESSESSDDDVPIAKLRKITTRETNKNVFKVESMQVNKEIPEEAHPNELVNINSSGAHFSPRKRKASTIEPSEGKKQERKKKKIETKVLECVVITNETQVNPDNEIERNRTQFDEHSSNESEDEWQDVEGKRKTRFSAKNYFFH